MTKEALHEAQPELSMYAITVLLEAGLACGVLECREDGTGRNMKPPPTPSSRRLSTLPPSQMETAACTAIANGNSRMYTYDAMEACIQFAELVVERIHDNKKTGHTLLVCRPEEQ